MISVSKTSEPDDLLPVDVISAILSRGASRNVVLRNYRYHVLPRGTYSTQTPDGLLLQFLDIKDAIEVSYSLSTYIWTITQTM